MGLHRAPWDSLNRTWDPGGAAMIRGWDTDDASNQSRPFINPKCSLIKLDKTPLRIRWFWLKTALLYHFHSATTAGVSINFKTRVFYKG